MNQPTSVELSDRAGQCRGDSEEGSDLHRLKDEAIERLAACVVDHEHRLPAFADEFQWPQRPDTIQVALKSELVRETIDGGESWMRSGRFDGYERVRLALGVIPPKSAEGTVGISPQHLYGVAFPTGPEQGGCLHLFDLFNDLRRLRSDCVRLRYQATALKAATRG